MNQVVRRPASLSHARRMHQPDGAAWLFRVIVFLLIMGSAGVALGVVDLPPSVLSGTEVDVLVTPRREENRSLVLSSPLPATRASLECLQKVPLSPPYSAGAPRVFSTRPLVQGPLADPVSRTASPTMPAARNEPQRPITVSVVYEVALFKQEPHSYECGPTAVSMVLHYYHQQDSSLPQLTPLEVIQGLGERYNPSRGVAANRLVRGLKEMGLGYRTIGWEAGLDRERLLDELQEGPVIVQVHINFSGSGYPHMVVVTGMSGEGSRVHVNDPWTGRRYEIAWDVFERSWSFPEYPEASRIVIRLRP